MWRKINATILCNYSLCIKMDEKAISGRPEIALLLSIKAPNSA
jgi:hypothetical protein